MDLKTRDEFGLTPLHYAAGGNDNPAVVETPLAAESDPNARDKENDRTALLRGARERRRFRLVPGASHQARARTRIPQRRTAELLFRPALQR